MVSIGVPRLQKTSAIGTSRSHHRSEQVNPAPLGLKGLPDGTPTSDQSTRFGVGEWTNLQCMARSRLRKSRPRKDAAFDVRPAVLAWQEGGTFARLQFVTRCCEQLQLMAWLR